MKKVRTVLGEIEPSRLGRTRIHEHVLLCLSGADRDPRHPLDLEAVQRRAVGELSALAGKSGIATVVDATPFLMVPDHGLLARVAEAAGINVIASAGFYVQPSGLPDYYKMMDIDALAEILELQVTRGEAGVKAGIIKVSSRLGGITEEEERVFRAAARVQQSTGVPIITHTEAGTLGGEQLAIMRDEGADPARVVIGHSCGASDLSYHLNILKQGACLGFDRIGLEHFQSDEVRAAALTGLIAQGYGDRILLSMDHVIAIAGDIPALALEAQPPLTYLHDKFLPGIVRAGVSAETIEGMLTENPRRLFGG